MRCIDVAALVAAARAAQEPAARRCCRSSRTWCRCTLEPRATACMTNAAKLAAIGGGGTNCSAPLALLEPREAKGDLVVFVSDNESWVDCAAPAAARRRRCGSGGASRRATRGAKLVCIDMQPYGTTQAAERADVLNVGGFSDAVFDVVAAFARGGLRADHWVGAIFREDRSLNARPAARCRPRRAERSRRADIIVSDTAAILPSTHVRETGNGTANACGTTWQAERFGFEPRRAHASGARSFATPCCRGIASFTGRSKIRRGRKPAQNNHTGGSPPATDPGRNAVVITFAKMTDHAKPLSFRLFVTANACGTPSSTGRLTPDREPDSPLSGAQSRKPLSLQLEP